MAAVLGDAPRSLENQGDSTDMSVEKAQDLSALMDRLHSRVSQHKNWAESIKAVRMAIMNDKRQQSEALERAQIQACLDKLNRAVKVVNQQSLLERLDSIGRQLNLLFSVPAVPDNYACLSSDMFKVDIFMETGGVVKDVKVSHHGDPSSCEELTEVLSKGNFDEFVVHLQGLQDIYKIGGDKKQKSKAFLALHSLETDLNDLAQLQSSIKGVSNCIHKSPLGILLPRKGGCPMKLIYFVSPYDLLDKKTKSPHALTVEAITEHELGQSVTICIEQSSNANLLQTIPLMSVIKQDGKSLPCFQALSTLNGVNLPACFVLVLPQPIPVAMSNIQSIQNVTKLDVITTGETKSLLTLIQQQLAAGQTNSEENEFFVTLPDQQHVYYMSDISGNSLDQAAVMVSRIPFTHPTSVAQVLNHLRQQLLFNTVIGSCIRPHAKQDLRSSVVFELAAASLQSVTVMFEHPLQNTMVTADIDLCDITNTKFHVCIGEDGEELCSDDIASKIFQRCLSIPVTLRSVIHKVSEELRKDIIPPEPVLIETNNVLWQRPHFISPTHNTVHFQMESKIPAFVTPSLPPGLPLPPQVPQKPQNLPVGIIGAGMMDTGSSDPSQDKPSTGSNPLLATLLDQDSPSPEPSPVNESPMLSKLLGEEATDLASSKPALPQQKVKKLSKRRSRDTITGRSPKHRFSDSDSSFSMDHVDSMSFDSVDLQQGMNQGGAVGAVGAHAGYGGHPHSRGSSSSGGPAMIDLTTPSPDPFMTESPMKKLENTLDNYIPKEQQQLQQLHQQQHGRSDKDVSMMLTDIQKDVERAKELDKRSYYPANTVPKNEIVSTSLEELLTGSREVMKTSDPNKVTLNACSQASGTVAADEKGLSSPVYTRQNSFQNAQNQHSKELGETPVSGGSSSRSSMSCSPVYSDYDTPNHEGSSNSKSSDNKGYGVSAILSGSKVAASGVQAQMTGFNSAIEIKRENIKTEGPLRSMLEGGKRERFENNVVNDVAVKQEHKNLKLTLKKNLVDVSLPKSKSTEMFEFNSDEDDEPFTFISDKRNMTVISASPTRLQIHKKQSIKMSPMYDSKQEKNKKKESKHSISETGKRKREKYYESKKEKKKRKVVEGVSSQSLDETTMYTSTVETDVKSDNLKMKFIKSGGKLSTESSPKTSSPLPSKDKGDNSRKVSKEHLEKHDSVPVKIKSSSSSSQKSSHRSHHRSLSASSITVSKADSKLITKTPTIKLKPIAIPTSSASVNFPSAKTPPASTSASTKGQSSLTPTTATSATIGRIGAVSLATSGKSGSVTPPPSSSSKATTPTSAKANPIGKTPSAASIYSSKSQPSNSSTSGKTATNSNRSSTGTSRNSVGGLIKNSNGLLSSGNKMHSGERKGGSPSLSGGRNTPTSKSSSSLTKSSTSSNKPQSGSSSNAANVLSFLQKNASGIASLPPIPKLSSSSSGNANKSNSISTPLSSPAVSSSSTTSSYSSNSTTSKSAGTTTSTNYTSSKPNNVSSYSSPNSGINNKSPGSAGAYNSKNYSSSTNSSSTKNQISNNSSAHSVNKTSSQNMNNKHPIVSNKATPSMPDKSSSPSVMKVNDKMATNSVNNVSVKNALPASNSPSVSTSSVKQNSGSVSADVTKKREITASTTVSVTSADSVTPPRNSTPTTTVTGSVTDSNSASLASAVAGKAKVRKNSLSAVIDKLTKSSAHTAQAVVKEGVGHEGGEDKLEELLEDDADHDEAKLLESSPGGKDALPAGVKRVSSVNQDEDKVSNTSKQNPGPVRGRSESSDSVFNSKGSNNFVQKSPGSKINTTDSPSRKTESVKVHSSSKDTRNDSRNVFTSILDSLMHEEKEQKSSEELNAGGDADKSVTNKTKMANSDLRNDNSDKDTHSKESNPSPAKKPRTQSPSLKTNSNKFNGETNAWDNASEKDVFKVPTPKSNCMEEKDNEDTENLTVRRKARVSSTKPPLSPASPASSPENLIIDCQTMSPRTLQNKTNSPHCNSEVTLSDMDNNKRINSGIKNKSHTPSPKVVKHSPINSPMAVLMKGDHSNPGSVASPPQCDIDDDLMDEAIMGYGS